MSGGLDAVIQYAPTGTIDWGNVAFSVLEGGFMGGLGFGFGKVIHTLGFTGRTAFGLAGLADIAVGTA